MAAIKNGKFERWKGECIQQAWFKSVGAQESTFEPMIALEYQSSYYCEDFIHKNISIYVRK